MPEHILVTGGAGFIGSHLVDGLLAAGHRVRVLDNLEEQVHGNLHETQNPPAYFNPEAEFIFGDIRDPRVVAKALENIDVVFHEAALVGVGQSMYHIDRFTDVNTHGTAILLQAITNSRQRPRKLVVASSMSIYGEGVYHCPDHGQVFPSLRSTAQLREQDWELNCPVEGCKNKVIPQPTHENKPLQPTSIYAINKRDHEEMFLTVGQAYNISTTALRYFNVYGSRQALSNPYTGVAAIFSSRLLNNHPPVIFEDGLQRRDFIHVSDIVQANLLVMNSPASDFKAINVGSGQSISILDVAQTLTEHLGLNLLPEIVQKFRAGDIRHCYSDISRLQALGYQPMVSFSDGMAGLVDWVRQQSVTDIFEQARQELVNKGLTA